MNGKLHTPAALLPEKHPRTHLRKGLVRHKAGVNVLEKRNNVLAGIRTPDGPACSLVTIKLGYPSY